MEVKEVMVRAGDLQEEILTGKFKNLYMVKIKRPGHEEGVFARNVDFNRGKTTPNEEISDSQIIRGSKEGLRFEIQAVIERIDEFSEEMRNRLIKDLILALQGTEEQKQGAKERLKKVSIGQDWGDKVLQEILESIRAPKLNHPVSTKENPHHKAFYGLFKS